MTLFRPSFPWGGDLGRASPYISMLAPDTTGVIPNGSHYRDSVTPDKTSVNDDAGICEGYEISDTSPDQGIWTESR